MSTVGNKSKLGERLKRIILFRRKKISKSVEENLYEDSNSIYINFLKVIAALPGLIYSSFDYNKSNVNIKEEVKDNVLNDDNITNEVLNKRIDNRVEKRKIINNINIEIIKRNQNKYYNKSDDNYSFKNEKVNLNLNNNYNNLEEKISDDIKDINIEKVKKLEKSIINLIKKDLIRIVNEMEILQSELYILSEVNGENKELKNCQKELNQIKDMICKIDKLKEKYDFLRDNYDFEYLLEIDNDDLVDKIIELKDTFGKNELKAVSEDYKLLDAYKYLYLKIDDLHEKTSLFEQRKKEEELKLKERDIDFESLKLKVYNVDYMNRNYTNFVENQALLLKKIDADVNNISSYEHVDIRLKEFNNLFNNSFKYFCLLMLNPLKGIIPSIATETLITRNLIKNLYNNLEWEETRKMVYEGIDYSSMINNAISDLDSTSRIVDDTLDDIVHLKMKYNDNFKKYQGDFVEYRDIMHKINDMENKILGNKIKIEIMKKRALEQRRENEKKLVLLKKLNEKENTIENHN